MLVQKKGIWMNLFQFNLSACFHDHEEYNNVQTIIVDNIDCLSIVDGDIHT